MCASAQVLLVMMNTVASVLDLFSLSSYIVQLCQHWTSASLINNQQSLSSNAPSRLRASDVISYFCILQSPLPALISEAGNKVTHCSFYSHSDRKSMSSSISKWARSGGGHGERVLSLQCGRVHGSHVGFCSSEEEDGLHRHPPGA